MTKRSFLHSFKKYFLNKDKAVLLSLIKAPVSLKLNVRRVKRLKKDARLSDESDAVESEGSAHLAESSDSDDSTVCYFSKLVVYFFVNGKSC